MLSLAVAKLPEGSAWSYELKFDGYRAIALKAGGQVHLLSRNGKDYTAVCIDCTGALEPHVIDGEVIAYDVDGRASGLNGAGANHRRALAREGALRRAVKPVADPQRRTIAALFDLAS
jgi:ATP dependent DNA ligase-like protein